ncbi:MAG: polysaccharide pyruvyl transferase CsaB [Cyanobacteriota bacterium]|nr:polysaccharide pyruvyl transferase CsaB [Cyanobacteriota bacterium]
MHPLLVGYYGEHNLGDDALLEVLLSQLPAGCTPRVTAHDQLQIQQRFGVHTVDRRSLVKVLQALQRCDSLVLGGGSLLQDATSFSSLAYYSALIAAARLQGKRVLLWGQGLGPLSRRRSRLVVRALLRLCDLCSWRDPDSAALAGSLGWRARPDQPGAGVGSDPVWALAGSGWSGVGGPVVLCWRPVSQLQGSQWMPWLNALESLASDRELLWLPFHGDQDRGLLRRLSDAGLLSPALQARSREVMVEQPQAAMEVFRSAGLVVSMRLHGLILAAVSGAPVAALSYDPKVSAAAGALGCPSAELNQAAPPDLADQWNQILDQPPAAVRVEILRDNTAVHAGLLSSLC